MLNKLNLPPDIIEVLTAIHKKAKALNPELTEELFLHQIIDDWLKPLRRTRNHRPITKSNIVVKNRIKEAVKLSGKTQEQVAKETGVSRSYLNQLLNGHYDTTITTAMLMARATHCTLDELFYIAGE